MVKQHGFVVAAVFGIDLRMKPRRLALLPSSKALDWEALMQTPSYLNALSLLP